ncbi:phytanoyl-CoA dioxygenase family protein [Rhodopila sp.]|uniref:phytanoyl-CoA dioxygenase family protein n=1 Tax=Rhodopila sp. TaxID=2480087 RepID=UPI003D0E98FB
MNRLDAAMVDRFRADGFLPFDTGLPASDIAALRSTLMGLHNENVGFEEGALFDAMGVDDGSAPARFPQILHPRSFAPELIGHRFYHVARAIAEQLLGSEVRFKADISLMKPARIGEATPWHQDEAFQDPRFDYDEVSFWLALQPVDKTNSCMAYLPGSHHGPVLPHGFPGGDSRIHALECVGGFDMRDTVACPVPAGWCVIHTGRTLHGAGPNLSDGERMAYVLIFDRVPTPARAAREFPWRAEHRTARAQREMAWRRNGGLLVHLWRQRTRMRVTSVRTLLFDIRRAARAVRNLVLTD